MAGADSHGADLKGVNLKGINGAGTLFKGVKRVDADLDPAVLSGADLTCITALRAAFNHALLNGATLIDASLNGTNFDEAEPVRRNPVECDLDHG